MLKNGKTKSVLPFFLLLKIDEGVTQMTSKNKQGIHVLVTSGGVSLRLSF